MKTRLAKSIGDEAALAVYNQLVEKTCEVANRVEATKFAIFNEVILHDDSGIFQNFKQSVQRGNDLGEKMKHAFDMVFRQGFEKAIIIGSDCPELLAIEIENAFILLNENDLVIGPAEDGGYYLLGMKKTHAELFQIEKWSTPNVFRQTMEKAAQLNLKCYKTTIKRDLDDEQDLNFFQEKGIFKQKASKTLQQ